MKCHDVLEGCSHRRVEIDCPLWVQSPWQVDEAFSICWTFEASMLNAKQVAQELQASELRGLQYKPA